MGPAAVTRWTAKLALWTILAITVLVAARTPKETAMPLNGYRPPLIHTQAAQAAHAGGPQVTP